MSERRRNRELELSSELELNDSSRHVCQPQIKHHRILDSTNTLTVPIYSRQ
ncbi:hypothetical protein chiPu_0020667, partial [Chiloscyllium punctatum]|nr:hypothetical protein [Chiloscyllium punctatum]